MNGYDEKDAKEWILQRMERKPFLAVRDRLPQWIEDFIRYDLHFMRLTGVLGPDDCQGENEYDEDEAFEFLYDAYLSDHPDDTDDDMLVAAALNRYMELEGEYLAAHGLSEQV